MEDLSLLAELREEEERKMNEDIAQMEERENEKFKRLRGIEESRLLKQVEKIQSELESIDMVEQDDTVRYSEEDAKLGNFFYRLTALESLNAQYAASVEGLTATNKYLSDELSTQEAAYQKELKRLEDIKLQLNKVQVDADAQCGELNDTMSKYQSMIELFNSGLINCIDIKSKLTGARVTGELEALNEEKAELVKTLREKTDELKALQIRAKAKETSSLVGDSRRKTEMEMAMSPMKWTSQRASMISKIRKLKQNIEELNNRNRSTMSSSARVAEKNGKAGFNEREVKRSIQAEMNAMKQTSSQFQNEVYLSEIEYKKELERELQSINNTYDTISSYKTSVREIVGQIPSGEEELDLLRKELADLKSSMR